MSLDSKIKGLVRGLVSRNYPEGRDDQQFEMNNRGDQLVAAGLPPETELVRMGQSYVSTGTAVAPVAAVPTTAAHLSLFNGEPVGGKSYLISVVGAVCTTTVAAAASPTLLAHLGTKAETDPAGTVTIKSLSGAAYRGKGNTKASVTIVNSGVWHPVGPSVNTPNTANIGLGVYQDVYGRYILPPQQIFSLATLNATAAGAFTPYVIWHEVQLLLG